MLIIVRFFLAIVVMIAGIPFYILGFIWELISDIFVVGREDVGKLLDFINNKDE